MVSVQLIRTPGSGTILSFIRSVQTPEIGTLPKDGVYVWSIFTVLPPVRLCSVLAVVPSGAMSSTRRSPIQVCAISTETETDVAVPELETVMVSDTV